MILKVFNDAKYNAVLNINLDIQEKTIILKTNEVKTILSFDELKNSDTNSGFDRYVVQILHDLNQPEESKLAVKTNIINLYAETAVSKLAATEYFQQTQNYGLLHIMLRAEDKSFNDCVIFLNATDDGTFTCNKEFTYSKREITKPPKFYFPELSIKEIERNNTGIVLEIVAPVNVNKEAYLKTNLGHVPSKIKLIDGKGRFLFTPLGMFDGDVATVKVGYRFYSNITSIELTK